MFHSEIYQIMFKRIMNFKKTIKTIVLCSIMTLTSLSASAQDLLARQAPIDRKMKAVDSMVVKGMMERESFENPSADLYQDWDNRFAHKATTLPETYKIDLRGFAMPTRSRVITSKCNFA